MDTVEGPIDGDRNAWRCDVFADVMYVRLEAERDTPTVGEMNDACDVIDLRAEDGRRLVGPRWSAERAVGGDGFGGGAGSLGSGDRRGAVIERG